MVPTQDDVTSLQQSLSVDVTSLPPPVSDYSPMTPSFVLNKMKALASEGDTSEVAAYIDRLGPAAPEAGVQGLARLCALPLCFTSASPLFCVSTAWLAHPLMLLPLPHAVLVAVASAAIVSTRLPLLSPVLSLV